MNTSPKISVLMSVYNGEKWLREAIDSILGQTFTDFEFIIINDGSTDGTADILQSYDDERVVLVDNEENIGLTKSLNKGIKIARGKYIARMDADDISLPERFNRQVNYLEEHPEIVLLSSYINIIDESGELVTTLRRPASHEEISILLLFGNIIGGHSQTMFLTSAVRDLGGYNETIRYAQDYDLWWRLSKVGKVAVYPEALLCWRRNISHGISFTKRQQQADYVEKISLQAVREFMDGEPIDEEAYKRLRIAKQGDWKQWQPKDARILKPLWRKIGKKGSFPPSLRDFLITWSEKLLQHDRLEGLLLIRMLRGCLERNQRRQLPSKLIIKLILGSRFTRFLKKARQSGNQKTEQV